MATKKQQTRYTNKTKHQVDQQCICLDFLVASIVLFGLNTFHN